LTWPGDPNPEPDLIAATTELDELWDFKRVSSAAKLLLAALPEITAHWKEISRLLPDSTICHDLQELERRLSATLEYIEFPLGRSTTIAPRIRKPWQNYSLLIARIVINRMTRRGRTHVAISRNSIVVRIVHCAMLHINVEDIQTVTKSGISAFLSRWDQGYGLRPQAIAPLTTN
jgi:hypothetical protein